MKEEITFNRFCDRFKDMNRDNNFSYNGKRALFDYLEEMEEQTDEPYELDIIALCCDYTEYESIKEYLENYNTTLEKEDFDSDEEFNEAVREGIADNTIVIPIDDESFIIQNY